MLTHWVTVSVPFQGHLEIGRPIAFGHQTRVAEVSLQTDIKMDPSKNKVHNNNN